MYVNFLAFKRIYTDTMRKVYIKYACIKYSLKEMQTAWKISDKIFYMANLWVPDSNKKVLKDSSIVKW